MKVAGHEVDRFFLSSMAEVSQQPFRVLCRELGAGLATTELLQPEVFFSNDEHALRLRAFDRDVERPRSVQLHGDDLALVTRAAVVAVNEGADVLELNLGNPLGDAHGKSVLLEPKRGGVLLRAVRSAIDDRVPVWVKTRAGIHSPREVFALATELVDAGCAALTVHARTRSQKYSGPPGWDLLAELKASLPIPLIGNGDVVSAALARELFRQTGVDAVAIGRGALGRPWLFRQLRDDDDTPPTDAERERVMRRHWELHLAFHGDEARARHTFEPHAQWYNSVHASSSDEVRGALPHSRGLY